MPDYLKRTGRDVTDDILVRVPESEKHIARLKGPASKRLGIDRGSIPSVAAPLEGQMMIQYADEAVGSTPVSPDVGATFNAEQPYYYSNGEWRPYVISAAVSSAVEHLQVLSTSCPAISTTVFDWTHYDGASLLDLTVPGVASPISGGVYAVTAEVTITLPTVEPAGDAFDVWLHPVQAAHAPPAGFNPPALTTAITSGDTFQYVFATVALTEIFVVGDYLKFEILNRTSYAVDFQSYISAVRVLSI